jgi:protoporphyrinogen/coproporphyrinogen III oxidase
MKIGIIGGGIAGLSAAWTLEKARRQGTEVEYRLFERSDRLGGIVRTERLPDGAILEAGPDSFITEKPWAAEFCRELGLKNDLIGSKDAERRTFILLNNRLVPLPDGLQFFVPTKIGPVAFSPLFSWGTRLRFALEYLWAPARVHHDGSEEDESVASFVKRHFGREVVERLAEPLLAGIYGGAADQLSVKAVLPRMAQFEATHGSVIRGMLASRKAKAGENLNAIPATARPLFTTLKAGMQQMVDAVARQLNADWLHVATAVGRLEYSSSISPPWRAQTSADVFDFDAVVLAMPAWSAAALLNDIHAELAAQLDSIPYSSSITLNLGYRKLGLGTALEGFGFLIPRAEGRRLLACTFPQNKFPHRAAGQRAFFRCFLAGDSAEEAMNLSDDEVAQIAGRELHQILGIRGAPELVRVWRWRRAMPQYVVNHTARIAEINRLRKQLPGLALAGNAYTGIGVPDCIRTGSEAATELLGSRAAVQQPASPSVK